MNIVECMMNRNERHTFHHRIRMYGLNRLLLFQVPETRQGGWKPIRIRSDKAYGNSIKTVENVVKSISDNISLQDLENVINKQK